MRILHVIQEFGAGGAERVMLSLIARAQAFGHDTAVAAAPGPLAHGVRCEQFDLPILQRRPRRVPAAAWKLWRVARAWNPDLIHCHNPGMAITTALATGRGSRIPALVSMHGVPDEDYAAASRVLRWAGLPVVACGPGVESALADHRVPVRATIVNGVSPPPAAADRRALIGRWRLRRDLALILSVGRLVPQKNHALAIHALTRIPEAALIIVGAGPLHDDLLRLAEDVGVTERVILLGGRSDARALMGAADVVVISSHWEGLPLVALETLAAGTALVSTEVRGLRELLRDEVDCLLVPPDDAPRLAHAIRRVLRDKDLRHRLALEGRKLAASYSEEEMAERFLALYEEVAGKRSR